MPYHNKHYRKLFEQLIDIVLIVNRAGQILYANLAAEKAYGYTAEELATLNIYAIRQADAKDTIDSQLNLALLQGIEFQAVHYRKDGFGFPVTVRSIFIDGSHGEEVISIIQDRSQMRLIEEQANIFETSLALSDEALIVSDENFRIIYWSPAAKARFGFEAGALVGRPVDLLIPKDRFDELIVIKELLKMGKSIQQLETQRLNSEGQVFDVSVSYSPIMKPEGEVQGYLAVYSDLTEKKKAKELLIRSQERAAKALEGANFCIWEIDLSQSTLDSYNRLEKMLGYDENEIGHAIKDWLNFVAPEDQSLLLRTYKQHEASAAPFVVETRMRHKSGRLLWVRSKGQITERDEQGKALRMLGTNELIDDRKQIEAELIEKNEVLTKLSEEAKRANEAKSQFLANVSHEIRTPLNGIVSIVQLLAKTQLDEEQHRLLKLLTSSSQTLEHLVTDILDLSKAEQQTVLVNLQAFSMKELYQLLFAELQVLANKKGIEAGFYADANLPDQVIGDVQKLKQILNNLLSNALKFTERGYIGIRIKVISESLGDLRVKFEVKDTGVGIGKDFERFVFEPFSQAESGESKAYSGTGLGLSIAKRYAEAMGGTLSFTSELGQGSTFELTLPFTKVVVDSSLESEPVTLKHIVPTSVVPAKTKARTILSVDDNFVNQTVIEMVIEKMGHHCVKAYHADEALEVLNKQAVDLVLMDIQMPHKSGYELTRQLRETESFKDLPIIAMTAYSRLEDQEKCLSMGMNAYVTKPLDLEQLQMIISEFFKGAQAPDHRI